MVKTLLIVLFIAGTAIGQISVQDAEKKSQEKQEARSDPKSTQSMEAQISAMRMEIAKLSAEVASLRAERDRLAAEVSASARPTTEPATPSPTQDAIDAKRLTLGMTLDQARLAMGAQGKLIDQTQAGSTYAWEKFATDPNHTVGTGPLQRMVLAPEYLYTQFGEFDADGKLIRISRNAGNDLPH